MKKLILFLYIITASVAALAQDQSCRTPPIDSTDIQHIFYYDNNQILYDSAASRVNPAGNCTDCRNFGANGLSTAIRKLPVKAWIYRDSDGNGWLQPWQVENLIRRVNNIFEATGVRIHLYMSGFQFKNETLMYDNPTDSQVYWRWANHRDTGVLNMHFVLNFGVNPPNGMANYPWMPWNFSSVVSTNGLDVEINGDNYANTIAHEIGHNLGLLHTHAGGRFDYLGAENNNMLGCYQEFQSRAARNWAENGCFSTHGRLKCEINGDFLCDTDGDPKLSSSKVLPLSNNPPCEYIGGGTDKASPPHGWTPPTRNMMSYTRRECRTEFTTGQREVMYNYSIGHWTYTQNTLSFLNREVDVYEPDNFRENAQVIDYNSSQHHAFHLVRTTSGVFQGGDVDWVRFQAPFTYTGPITVSTSAVPGAIMPNTLLTLFDAAGSQIAENDNMSSTSLFSHITFDNYVPGSHYFVRISNLSAHPAPEARGEYRITLEGCTGTAGIPSQLTNASYHFSSSLANLELGNVTVGSSGQLLVNTLANSSTTQQYTLLTSSCGANVVINDGGVFEIGSAGATLNTGHRATVHFRVGSTLRLNDNSTLRIRDNSRLIIEPGAELVVRGTPNIILEGTNAVLEINGGLDIRSGTFATAATSTGFVRFDMRDPNGHAIKYLTNAQSVMHLEGNAPWTQKIAEIAAGTKLEPSKWGYAQLTLRNGTINMGYNAFIQAGTAPAVVEGVRFLGSSVLTEQFRGIDFHGQQPLINNSRFFGCIECITYSPWKNQPVNILISNTVFEQFGTAIRAHQNGGTIRNCTFSGLGQSQPLSKAIQMDAGIDNTLIENCTISGCFYGVLYIGNSGSNLLMKETLVNGMGANTGVGVWFNSTGTFRGECGSLQNLMLGLRVDHGRLDLSHRSKFNIVNNKLSGNVPNNIYLHGAEEIDLYYGHNSIVTTNGSGIRGTLQYNGYSLSGKLNHWRTDGGPPRNRADYPTQYDVDLITDDYPAQVVYMHDPSPVQPQFCGIDPCVVPVRTGVNLPCSRTLYCPDCEEINTPSYQGDSLHLAILDAISYSTFYDSLGSNELALERLHEILTYQLDDTSVYEHSALNFGFRMMKDIYALLHGTLPIQTAKYKLLEVLHARLEATDDSTSILNPKFHLYLDQALTHFVAGDVATAREQLVLAQPSVTIAYEDFYAYWDCYLRNLHDLNDSLISIYEFYALTDSCSTMGAMARGKSPYALMDYLQAQQSLEPKSKASASTLQLMPNPATLEVTLQINLAADDKVAVRLFDMKGVEMPAAAAGINLRQGNNSLTLATAALPQGLYMVRVTGAATNLAAKLVVER